MRKIKPIIILLGCLVFLLSRPYADEPGKIISPSPPDQSESQGPFIPANSAFMPGEVLVKFKPIIPAAIAEASLKEYGSTVVRRISRIDVYVLRTPEGVTAEEMAAVLNLNPSVEYAELNAIATIAVTPNDPFFRYQYALYNTGQTLQAPGSPSGKPSADIKATTGWEETKGSEGTVIAVIDTGCDLRHPDLDQKFVSSGRDFINDDFDASDDHSHGTHVAGIAAAETDNNEGIAGVAWMCKILPVKVLDSGGSGPIDKVAQGIIWAADNGADIINLSLSTDTHTLTLRDAVKYAFEKDIVIAAAAGNAGSTVRYPAAYDSYCLAVAATDYNDTRPSWSCFGAEVDVAAPGVAVVSAVPVGYFGPGSVDYGYKSGTSMSTPHVAGLAALIRSLKPFLTATEIMNIIRYSADDINSDAYPGKDEFLGYGRINMEKALVPLIIKN